MYTSCSTSIQTRFYYIYKINKMDTITLIIAIFAGIIAIAALVLSLVNTFGTQETGPRGPKGDTGPPGPRGPPCKSWCNDNSIPNVHPNNPPNLQYNNPPNVQYPNRPGPQAANISLTNTSYRTGALRGQTFNFTGPITHNPSIFIEYDSSLQPGDSFIINTSLLSSSVGITSPYYHILGNPPNNVIILDQSQSYVFILQPDRVSLQLSTNNNKPCEPCNRTSYTTSQWM